MLVALVLLASGGVMRLEALEIRDDSQRTVTVPATVERVFPAGPPAGLVIYALDPKVLLGWTMKPSAPALEFLGPEAAQLPALGWIGGRGGDANLESVLRLKPDVIIDIGSTGGTYVSLAERIRAVTGIPYLLLSGRLEDLPATYRTLGAVLGQQKAAEVLAQWIESHLKGVADQLAKVPQESRPKVYLARGPSGLESARSGSINMEAIELAGGRDAVPGTGSGLVTVSLEQLYGFDPDVIVVLDPAFFARMGEDAAWSKLSAVRKGKVVLAPQLPFPWVDYPPSVNRMIGVLWLAKMLHPGVVDLDLRAVTKEFYALFYHHELNDDAFEALMKNARLP